ncbi:MAG: hypothetical protein M1834_003051 [Cirrosporium novae-zelandiae]|nr:MAG: hypothetical protein M1834_003051 [Cirrosporium novae-zelandiae]
MPSRWNILRHCTAILAVTAPLLAQQSYAAAILARQPDASTTALASSAATSGTETTVSATAKTTGDTAAKSTDAVSATDDIVTTRTTKDAATSTSDTAESATASRTLDGDFPVCHEATGPLRPFCLPTDGRDNGGQSAWTSDRTANSYGYLTVTFEKAWLQDNARNNLTFYIVEYDPSSTTRNSILNGPTVSLTTAPKTHYSPSPPTSVPNKAGLMIGLPVCLGFVLLVVCGLFIGMRKHRRIGLGNVMGRKRGYGIGKSRKQRVGKKGPIRLDEYEAGSRPEDPIFTGDARTAGSKPAHSHAREESLGSLVDSPRVNNFGEAPHDGGNAFRDEISRQRAHGD